MTHNLKATAGTASDSKSFAAEEPYEVVSVNLFGAMFMLEKPIQVPKGSHVSFDRADPFSPILKLTTASASTGLTISVVKDGQP